MKKQKKMSEYLPNWDLSDLYRSIKDPRIEKDLDWCFGQAKVFQKTYRGKVEKLTAIRMLKAVQEYERINQKLKKPYFYAFMVFSTATNDQQIQKVYQSVQERVTQLEKELLFFELEITRLPQGTFNKFIKIENLKSYCHWLRSVHVFKPHTLSEAEEKILTEKSQTSSQAWSRFFEQTVAKWKGRVSWKKNELGLEALLKCLYDPDRKKRKEGARVLTEIFEEHRDQTAYIFNTLLLDKSISDRLRKYSSPEQARILGEDIPEKSLRTLEDAVRSNYSLVHRYYRLKAKMMGLKTLYHYDRYAPLETKERHSTFDQARQTVLNAFLSFSPVFYDHAEKFFNRNWIDVPPKEGKRGGAYCEGMTPTEHPYVLLNFVGTSNDVRTLAHELGHGIHGLFATQQNSDLNFNPSLALAEAASTFAEFVLFYFQKNQRHNDRERLYLLCEKIEEIMSTVMRQVAMFTFERRVHAMRREQGELSWKQINDVWRDVYREMFGGSVAIGDEYGYWWEYISHVHVMPFYVFSYAFGELVVLSLFKQYQEEGELFIPKYIELLSAGRSESPKQLLKRLFSFDIESKEFWLKGLRLIEEMVDEAEELWGKIQKQ